MNSIFDGNALIDLALIFKNAGVRPVYEHEAEVEEENSREAYVRMGYISIEGNESFLKMEGRIGIELLKPGGIPHKAWRFDAITDWDSAHQELYSNSEFTQVSGQNIGNPELYADMFQHRNGSVVQIIWRRHPIFA